MLKSIFVAAVSAVAVAATPVSAQVAASSLVGSYVVNGTEADGKPYDGPGTLDVAVARSGALEFRWDGGKYVGVGQLTGNVLAVASSAEGRAVILLMTVNPDGTLSGKWWRRTDPGTGGTETWKRK